MALNVKPRTLVDFRNSHDTNVIVPNKMKAAFEAMEKIGPEHYLYEGEFLKLAGISQTQIAAFRDQFADRIVETGGKNPKRVYFATKKAASLARQ